MWSSSDGIHWTQVNTAAAFGQRYEANCVVFNNLMWVFGGYNAFNVYQTDAWSSPDGITWTQKTKFAFPVREGFGTAAYGGLMWVFGGWGGTTLLNDVWTSPNGIAWTRAAASAAFSPRNWPAYTVFNNSIWLIGGSDSGGNGYLGDVYHTP